MRNGAVGKTLESSLAVLISSTRSKKRTLSLIEIAEWLAFAVEELGSVVAVGDRIGLSPQMVRQFESVRKLTPAVQHLFETRRLDSVDAAAHLAMLPIKDQLPVAKLLADGKIDTSDVRAIHQQRKGGDRSPIAGLMDKVEKSKTKQEYVVEFVIRGSQDAGSVRNAIRKVFPDEQIVRLDVQGAMGRIVLTKAGRSTLSSTAKKFKVPLTSVMASVLQNR